MSGGEKLFCCYFNCWSTTWHHWPQPNLSCALPLRIRILGWTEQWLQMRRHHFLRGKRDLSASGSSCRIPTPSQAIHEQLTVVFLSKHIMYTWLQLHLQTSTWMVEFQLSFVTFVSCLMALPPLLWHPHATKEAHCCITFQFLPFVHCLLSWSARMISDPEWLNFTLSSTGRFDSEKVHL